MKGEKYPMRIHTVNKTPAYVLNSKLILNKKKIYSASTFTYCFMKKEQLYKQTQLLRKRTSAEEMASGSIKNIIFFRPFFVSVNCGPIAADKTTPASNASHFSFVYFTFYVLGCLLSSQHSERLMMVTTGMELEWGHEHLLQ